MSEIDDLLVGVMLHIGDDAEYAIARLINLTEAGEVTDKERRHIMKAVERRLKKERSGSDIYDLLLRLSDIINPSVEHESNELPPEMESPDAVLARRMRGDSTPANYETEDPDPSPTDSSGNDRYSNTRHPERFQDDWQKEQDAKKKKKKSDWEDKV